MTVTDPLSITTETVVRADSATTATLRVRTEELKRSVSSPQVSHLMYAGLVNSVFKLYVTHLQNRNLLS